MGSATCTSLPALRGVTHVVFDDPGAEHLLAVGASNVVRAFTALGVGPSRQDVVEHARVRRAWFDEEQKYDHLYSAEIRWEAPVVVWATPCLHDRLNLWRTCRWLRGRGIGRRAVFIVDLPPTPRGPSAPPRAEPFACNDSVFHHSEGALRAHLAAARPWPRERYDEAVRLWEQYVAPDPRRFARRCLQGVRGFPELGPTWAFLSRFFPRLSREGTLRVSRYDEILLRALSAEWKTPVKLYVGDAIQQHQEFFSCSGDVGMVDRLAAWAEHGGSLAVERAPVPVDPGLVMRSHVYRITERGMQLRAELPQLADAPRLPVGGAEAYAPEAPWVLLDDGRLARRGGATGEAPSRRNP